MKAVSTPARVAAAIIALLCWVGLTVQFRASLGASGSAGATIWEMLRFFTVIANLLVAITFTAIVLGNRAAIAPRVIGGVTLAMLLVGIVFALLLNGLLELSGGAALADLILHKIMPVAVTLYWLTLAPKGGLTAGDPVRWAMLPVIYFLYALGRGMIDGHYAYPFMNPVKLGWGQVAITALVMAAGFVIAGYAMIWLDRLFSRQRRYPR
jgi:hypothetical protein